MSQQEDTPLAAAFYQRFMKSLEDETIAHVPKVDDILTGTTESGFVLNAAEQYTLAVTLAERMEYAQTRVDEATWKSFCNNVGLFVKEHFAIELQATLYHLISKRHQIPFSSMTGTVLTKTIGEIKDILRKTI